VKNRIHWDAAVPGMPPLVRTEATVLREPGGEAGPGPSPPLTWRSSPPTPRASHSGTTQAA